MAWAERFQWISLAFGLLALGLIAPQWVALTPFYFLAGGAAIGIGLIADRHATERNLPVVLPARIGIFAGVPPVIVAVIHFTLL